MDSTFRKKAESNAMFHRGIIFFVLLRKALMDTFTILLTLNVIFLEPNMLSISKQEIFGTKHSFSAFDR